MNNPLDDDSTYTTTWGNFKAALGNAAEAGQEQERNKLVQDLQIIISVATANGTNADFISGLVKAQKHIMKLIDQQK